MKKIFALTVVLVLALVAGWWWHAHRGDDRFDYAAAFEQPASAGRTASLTDVVAIAGKDPVAVSQQLGEPQACEAGQYSRRCQYNGAGVEITYINDKADWITVPLQARQLPLSATTLAALGLPQREPDEVNQHEDIWRGLAGYREVRLVGNDQGAIYARIKVATL